MNTNDPTPPASPDAPPPPAARPSTDPRAETAPPRAGEPLWRVLGCFVLMLAALQLIIGPKVRLSQWELSAANNLSVAEGVAWLNGRLDIGLDAAGDPADPAHRPHDSAYFNGKVYNVFPPMMAILTVALSPLHKLLLDGRADFWLQTAFVLLVFWPLPIIGFVVFYRRTGSAAWGAVLTVAWMAGTALLPNLHAARGGLLGQLDHVVSQIGLLILAADVLGRQRIWPGLIGLLISTYTRQITFLYGFVLLWAAWRQGGWRRCSLCAAGLGAIAAPLLTLNYLKFGDPLDFGYKRIYVGRDTEYMGARCLTYGTFSTRFILGPPGDPGNAYYLFLAPPRIDAVTPTNIQISERNQNGTGLWITTPLALWVFLAAGRWWRDRKGRGLMLGTLPVIVGLLCYHSPGYMQQGYNRFALDFLPLWLAVVAPYTRGGWRTWFTLLCAAWGMLYFQAIVPNTTPLPRQNGQTLVMTVTHGEV
ncbi:MAG: hypothetical protein ACE5E1_04195 [Phycisphaerae bacterium]